MFPHITKGLGVRIKTMCQVMSVHYYTTNITAPLTQTIYCTSLVASLGMSLQGIDLKTASGAQTILFHGPPFLCKYTPLACVCVCYLSAIYMQLLQTHTINTFSSYYVARRLDKIYL